MEQDQTRIKEENQDPASTGQTRIKEENQDPDLTGQTRVKEENQDPVFMDTDLYKIVIKEENQETDQFNIVIKEENQDPEYEQTGLEEENQEQFRAQDSMVTSEPIKDSDDVIMMLLITTM